MAQRKIQLLRSTTIYDSQLLAKQSFTTALATSADLSDGEMLLARYRDGETGLKSILGVYNKKSGREGFTLIVDNETVDSLISELSDKITVIEGSVGLNNDGTYTGYTNDDIVGTTTTLKGTVDEIIDYIKGLDVEARTNATTDGKVLVTLSETDGLVSETPADLTDVKMGGYSKTSDTGAIAATDTLEQAFSKVENAIAKNSVSSNDKTITIDTTGATTDLSVNIDTTTIVKDASTGVISSALKVIKVIPSGTAGVDEVVDNTLSNNVKEAYRLVYNGSTTAIGKQIDIYKDSSLLSVRLLHATDSLKPTYSNGTWTDIDVASQTEENLALCFAYQLANGTTSVESVAVGDFLRESEFKDGLVVNSTGEVRILVDPTSEGFLTVSPNGLKLSGVQDLIDAETERAQDAEDELASLIGLTGTEGNRAWNPTTNYGTGAQSARDNMENIATALSGVIATVSGTAYLPSDAISVTQSQEVGHEDEFTIALELSADEDNVLEIKSTGNKGAYLSGTWDCGEY